MEVGGAEAVDGFLESGVELDRPLESGDGSTALTELETAAAEKIERLRELLAGNAGFEVVDGFVVVASPQFDAAEGEIGEKRLGHHDPRPFEGVASLVPVAEVRRRVAEIDQGLEVRASQLQNPPERGFGDLGLAGSRTPLHR